MANTLGSTRIGTERGDFGKVSRVPETALFMLGWTIMLGEIWSVLTLPFRLIAALVALCGRALGVVIGFALMVAGVAFCSGAIYILGLPLFVVGLLMTLKCLG